MGPDIYQGTVDYLGCGGTRDLQRSTKDSGAYIMGGNWYSMVGFLWRMQKDPRVRIVTCAVGRFTQDGVTSTSFSISAATVGSPMAIEISLRV